MKDQPADILTTDHSEAPFPRDEALQIIYDNVEDSFLLVDRTLRVVSTNRRTSDKILEHFGIELTEGMSILALAPPDRHAYLRKMYAEVLEGETRRTERELPSASGTIVVENIFKPARNAKGEIIGAIVMARNITELKRSEDILKELEERWRFALEGAKQGVWDWDLQTDRVFYSNSCKRLYGYTGDEMGDSIKTWKKLIHPDDAKTVENALANHMDSPNPFYQSTYRILAKDGNYRWILARGMITSYDGDGRPLRMIGTHTDITDQVSAEERIKTSERQYRTLFDSNPLPCWIYDSKTLAFLEVNQAAIEFYGYSRSEFLNATIEMIHPEDYLGQLAGRNRVSQNKKSLAFNNWTHRKKTGEPLYVDLRINSIDYKGTEAMLVVAHDVTAKVLVEAELRKSNERFLYAAKASSEALWEWDVASNEFYASPAYTDIFGWVVNEKRQFDEWHEYIHPMDREDTTSSYYRAIVDPAVELWSRQYRYLKTDGTYAVVIDKAIILRDAEGQPVKVIGAMQDVTAQKSAEAAMKESNERFQLVSRATSDAIYEWNVRNNQLYWGEGMFTLFGFHPFEVPISKWTDLIHPLDRERVTTTLEAAITQPGGELWKAEYRFGKAGGGYSYVLDRGFIIRDAEGKALRVIGSMQDITSRKYNEELLSLERTVFEQSNNPNIDIREIVYTLLCGIENLHEEAFTSVIVLREDDTIEPFSSVRLPKAIIDNLKGIRIGPEEGSCGSAMFNRQPVITGDISTDPKWTKYRDFTLGNGMHACWSLPIIHSQGKVMGAFAIYYRECRTPDSNEMNTLERVRNILRVLMENNWSINQIKAANERFDVMMKATHDLIWDWNLETNIIYRDEAGLRQVYGLDSNDSIDTIYEWLVRIHPDDNARVERVINEILQAGTDQNNFEVEYRFLRDDGTYSYVYDRGRILRNSEGRPVRMIGAAQDITERKRLEQELLQNELERQKAINQATVDTQEQERSEIGKELHDNVNQVLTTTKLYLDLALSNPELKDELIQKSTKNIISIINEIRQLSRSLMDPSIGDLGLIDSINDLIDNINLTRKLHVSLAAEKKIEGLLDKNHKLTIFRIIQEALNNAIKHAKATTVAIGFRTYKGGVEITIQDDGIGFLPSQIKKGAGLKNIQNRIYLINGTHSILSAPEKGCKIIINFPVDN